LIEQQIDISNLDRNVNALLLGNAQIREIVGNKFLEILYAIYLMTGIRGSNFDIVDIIRESPDLIVQFDAKRVGIEVVGLVETQGKKTIGSFEDILYRAEAEMINHTTRPFNASCYLNTDYTIKKRDKGKLVRLTVEAILSALDGNKEIDHPFIRNIDIQPHTLQTVSASYSWWGEYILTPELINKELSKKARNLDEYRNCNVSEVWLLMVANESGLGSFNIDIEKLKDLEYPTDFDRVFLLNYYAKNFIQIGGKLQYKPSRF
jgi:hypothetical protein